MINYVNGDATRPIGSDMKMITHVCNDSGGWGRGFVLSVSKRWATPEKSYRAQSKGLTLGMVQFIQVEPDIIIANMIAQHGYATENGIPPIRYEALERCLNLVMQTCIGGNFSVHMPRIGSSLAGGSWSVVSNIIDRTLISNNINVTVYDFPGGQFNP